MSFYGWRPYVPVAKRRANAEKKIKALMKKGQVIEPVTNISSKIANTFWGKAWCEHLEKFSDYENRLPRGRTYVRNGSVCHLGISTGNVEALVSGSELYRINIKIKPLNEKKWQSLRDKCTGKIGSALELLQGKFSTQIMEIVTDLNHGMFPKPDEIEMSCSCPDWAGLCKHLAAVMYGIGARLDSRPELLFQLRGVDHQDLITADLNIAKLIEGTGKYQHLAVENLSAIFGIEVDEQIVSAPATPQPSQLSPIQTVTTENKEFIFTGAKIMELRNSFNMNINEFALLIGVIPTTVKKWENSNGELNLMRRPLESLRGILEITPQQAQKILIERRTR